MFSPHSRPTLIGPRCTANLLNPLQSPHDCLMIAWNSQSAAQRVDFISAYSTLFSLPFLALPPRQRCNPCSLLLQPLYSTHWLRWWNCFIGYPYWKCFSSLSSLFFSLEYKAITITYHIKLFTVILYCLPGPPGSLFDELNTLLTSFTEEDTPMIWWDMNLEMVQSATFFPLLHSIGPHCSALTIYTQSWQPSGPAR